ncbi:hypothetical protein SporoP8_12115 [Sporosarcina ureae]|uniref:DUF7743 domain-containing protein n=1 Tax=Sporosarcina ureae TaxID=1571 RepID=UPI000A15CE4E|nr:hypothetical protein [Sporosarcina ureae]ARJ39554.1 hypothetical protein SporoP8_12115 [Sporosarcina ureae]
MKRKVMVLVLVFILLLPVVNTSAAGDSKPPVLNSLNVSTAELNVGDTLEIIADVTDDLSGVSDVYIHFQHAVNEVDRAMFFQLEYDEEVGLWKTSYVIKETDVGGKWRIESISLRDVANNDGYIHESKLLDKERYSYLIRNSNNSHVIPPTFQGVEVIEDELIPGQELMLKIKASHEKGIKSILVQYRRPNNQSGIGFDFKFDNETGYWIAKHPIGPHYQSGIWEFEALNIISNTGSRLWVGNEDKDIASSFDFKVNNLNTDLLPPTIKSIKVSPRFVKVGDHVTVTAEVEDDISGVGDIQASFIPPSRNSRRSIMFNDINNDGMFVGSYKVNKYDEEGQWNLESIIVNDKAENVKQYFPSDFKNHEELNMNVENFSSSEESEENPLTLNEFEVMSDVLNVGDELVIDMKVSQNVKYVQVGYSINKEGKRSTITIQPKLDKKTQSWIGKYTVKSTDKGGIWLLDDIALVGDNNEVKYINSRDLPNSQGVNITINNTDPLVIKSIDVSKGEIKTGEIANIIVKTQGGSSRISELSIAYHSPIYEVFGGDKYVNLVYDPKLDAWVGEFKAEATDVNGIWRFDSVYITENNNSNLGFYKEDVIGSGIYDINIRSENIIDFEKTVSVTDIETLGKENILEHSSLLKNKCWKW